MEIDINVMTSEDIISIEPNFSDNFDKFWSIDVLKHDFEDDNSQYVVAKMNNEIVGFAGIKIIIDEADIMNIAVKMDKRKSGIGSMLLEKLLEIAKVSNCTSITLEVNENNLPAIYLYEKYHFERIGLRKKYYNNTDNAILMKKDLIIN